MHYILPLVLSMLVYVACSDDANNQVEEFNEIPLNELEITYNVFYISECN